MAQQKMTGQCISFCRLLASAKTLSLSVEEKSSIAQAVGIGATRYDLLRVSADKPMVFNWSEALDFERQGGPFLQYAHARASNILVKTTFDNNYDPNLLYTSP